MMIILFFYALFASKRSKRGDGATFPAAFSGGKVVFQRERPFEGNASEAV